ncbi:MAG: hypothetical protein OXU45_03445 [Candidatus Melainabacteria bacterium]|nr:hypothetical protein [Candidatus Melainabacteria bacterium]
MEPLGQTEPLVSASTEPLAVNTANTSAVPIAAAPISDDNSDLLTELHNMADQSFAKTSSQKANGIWKLAEKFLKDKWPVRKVFALGNETAEGLRKLMFSWLPKPVAQVLYGALWSLAIVATGSRTAANAKLAAKPEDSTKAGLKMLMHDGIAAIGLPTAWIRLIADPVQEKIYHAIKLPSKVADVVRSAINIVSCYFLIGLLDKPAKDFSAKFLGYADDHHKVVNQKDSQRNMPALQAA